MSKSKAKGNRLENHVVDKLQEAHIQSERVPLSGSIGGKYSSDVVIGSIDTPLYRIECKNRESIADYLWTYLEPVDFLVLKKNHKQALVVMSIDQFTSLMQSDIAYRERGD
jgi:Holliday junction resolvase